MALSNKHLDGTGLSQLWAKVKEYFVAKEAGKGLSTNDYTTAEKTKLSGIASGAQKNVQSDWSATSGDAFIKNKPTSLPANGGNAATVGGHTVGKDVPADAVFTDTKPVGMKGATASAAGTAGYVPAPAAGEQAKFLRADGTWETPANTTYAEATSEKAGLMPAADKAKVDALDTNLGKKADKATTLAGYGITDAYTKTAMDTELGKKAAKATTLSGYGISDAYTKTATDAAIKKAVDAAVAGVYKIKGTIAFASLPTQGMVAGDTYNISDAFTTTAAFIEGAGKAYPAGSNVVYTDKGWDVMAGTYDFSDFVKTSDIQYLSEDDINTICTMA